MNIHLQFAKCLEFFQYSHIMIEANALSDWSARLHNPTARALYIFNPPKTRPRSPKPPQHQRHSLFWPYDRLYTTASSRRSQVFDFLGRTGRNQGQPENMDIRVLRPSDIPHVQLANITNLPENYFCKYYLYHAMSWPQLSYVAVDVSSDFSILWLASFLISFWKSWEFGRKGNPKDGKWRAEWTYITFNWVSDGLLVKAAAVDVQHHPTLSCSSFEASKGIGAYLWSCSALSNDHTLPVS